MRFGYVLAREADSALDSLAVRPLHVRGVVLPGDEERDLYVAGDRITFDRIAGAETIVAGGWLVPGLVDVHTQSVR